MIIESTQLKFMVFNVFDSFPYDVCTKEIKFHFSIIVIEKILKKIYFLSTVFY